MKKFVSLLLLSLLVLSLLTACGQTEPAPEEVSQPAPTTEEAPLVPIPASQILDGTYEITVASSSSMFRVVRCILTVEDDAMTAAMTMSGQGYGFVYLGTGEEALQDTEDTYVPFVLDSEGAKTFTVPIEALDQETDCAAWSIRKEKWYDRVLVFESAQIPAEALTLE